ncbi:11002_t:CDS:2, partial [Dentiscutata erythropus]
MVQFLLECSESQEIIESVLQNANNVYLVQYGSIYNIYYFKSYHKKEKLSYQKLSERCKSIGHSVNEIWASRKCWEKIIPEVFDFVAMMQKYAEHLQKSLQLTNNAHNSTKLVRISSKNCSFTIILGSSEINSNYIELKERFIEKELY